MSNSVEHGDTVVVVIEDDASVRAALKDLFESVGLVVKLYASGSAFREDWLPDVTSCLVLDVRLPETSGLKIQEELSRAGVHVPIVFVSGHGDVAMAVRAMKAGAIDFLTKPFRSQDLLDAVFAALERDNARRKMQQLHSDYTGILSVPKSAGARSDRKRSSRKTEQANSCRAGVERGHGEGTSRECYAKNARNDVAPPDKNA